MDHLEQQLRESLTRHAASPPAAPDLADEVVRRARRIRRRRRAAVTVAAVAAVVAGGLAFIPGLTREPEESTIATALSGPPRVPVVTDDDRVIDWPSERQRVRTYGEGGVMASIPDGLLVLRTDASEGSVILVPADLSPPRTLLEGVETALAVAADGHRLTTVVNGTAGRRLVEIGIPSGDLRRSVALTAPLVGPGEQVVARGYSGDRVLLDIGSDDSASGRRSAIWEPGDGQVIGLLDNKGQVFEAAGDVAAFSAEAQCSDIVQLRNGGGSWRLCDPVFRFSPDGRFVLAKAFDGGKIEVRDSAGGKVAFSLRVQGDLQSVGWESNDAFLYALGRGNQVDIVRCVVSSGDCRRAAEIPGPSAFIVWSYG
jgi:hypothetical protein